MSVTFVKKEHVCTNCGAEGKALLAIKYNNDILSQYATDSRPAEENLKPFGIYEEELTRDDFGILLSRVVKEKPCEQCGQFTLEYVKRISTENVLNFYPKTEAHKWLDGLAKAGV